MARPKGSKNSKVKAAQSVDETNNEVTKIVNAPTTDTTVVEVQPVIERPLSKGDTVLVIVDGSDKYWTRT